MQIHGVDIGFDMEGQLTEDLQIVFGLKSLISVVVPLVVKEGLYVPYHLRLELFVVIELRHDSKELGEVVAVVKRLIKYLNLRKNGGEVAHDVREGGHADDKSKYHEDPFD